MGNSTDLRVAWIKTGGVCGIASLVAYFLAAFAPLPDTLSYAAAFVLLLRATAWAREQA